jgi:hypothetical protein
MLKEQSQFAEGNPNANFTHATISAALGLDFFYRITVTNFSNTSYTLTMSDPLCDTGTFAFEAVGFSIPQPLAPLGTDVYYCQIDAISGAVLPDDGIPRRDIWRRPVSDEQHGDRHRHSGRRRHPRDPVRLGHGQTSTSS